MTIGVLFLDSLSALGHEPPSTAWRTDGPPRPPRVRPPSRMVVVMPSAAWTAEWGWSRAELSAAWLRLARAVALVVDETDEPELDSDPDLRELADEERAVWSRALGNVHSVHRAGPGGVDAAIAEAVTSLAGVEEPDEAPWGDLPSVSERRPEPAGPWVRWPIEERSGVCLSRVIDLASTAVTLDPPGGSLAVPSLASRDPRLRGPQMTPSPRPLLLLVLGILAGCAETPSEGTPTPGDPEEAGDTEPPEVVSVEITGAGKGTRVGLGLARQYLMWARTADGRRVGPPPGATARMLPSDGGPAIDIGFTGERGTVLAAAPSAGEWRVQIDLDGPDGREPPLVDEWVTFVPIAGFGEQYRSGSWEESEAEVLERVDLVRRVAGTNYRYIRTLQAVDAEGWPLDGKWTLTALEWPAGNDGLEILMTNGQTNRLVNRVSLEGPTRFEGAHGLIIEGPTFEGVSVLDIDATWSLDAFVVDDLVFLDLRDPGGNQWRPSWREDGMWFVASHHAQLQSVNGGWPEAECMFMVELDSSWPVQQDLRFCIGGACDDLAVNGPLELLTLEDCGD